VEFPAGAAKTSLVDRVEVAVVESNLPPQVKTLKVEEPGVVYLAAPPPSGPVIEAVHPDINGIFTVIDDSAPKSNNSTKGKKFYRAGYRTVSWEVADPNNDPLAFKLEIEDREGFSFIVREQIKGTQLGIDTSALPDGIYRFRLTASDAPRNPEGPLEVSRVSRWFPIDNSEPEVSLRRSGDSWVVSVRDGLSPVARAEWSRDGGRWTALAPTDGLLDGREETFEFPAASGRHMVVVRVVDRQHNRATAGATEE
jgi:catechol 2,3-dioxygenase-like lactoylglutathione lyase family enzyme